MASLEELHRRRRDLGRRFIDLEERAGSNPSFDDRAAMRSVQNQLTQTNRQIEEASGMRAPVRTSIYGGTEGGGENDGLTPGEAFVQSAAYRSWKEQYPSGGPAYGDSKSAPVTVGRMGNFLQLPDPTARMRTLITSAGTSAGDLVAPMHRGLVEPGLVRPLTLRQLVTVLPVSTDSIEYVKETGRVAATTSVAEASALTGTSGVKPEGGLTFDIVQDTIKTFAIWVPATKRILQDAPQLQAYINAYLTYDLGRELEDQMLAGAAAGEDFLGILNTPGVLTQSVPADHNNFDAIRLAKAQIVLTGRTVPNAVVLHPNDSAQMDVSKSGAAASPYNYWGSGPFGPGNGPARLWGMQVVESDAITENTALVGDFSKAILYDRESTSLSVGTAGEDFVRNIVRVLAEVRAGFGVIRPTAFAVVTLNA